MNPRANASEVLPVLGALLVIVGAAILVYSSIAASRRERETKRVNVGLMDFYAEMIGTKAKETELKQIIENRSNP